MYYLDISTISLKRKELDYRLFHQKTDSDSEMCVHGVFGGCSQEWHLGGSKGSRGGQRDKLNCDAGVTANPMGSSEPGTALQRCLSEVRELDLCVDQSHKAAPFGCGQLPLAVGSSWEGVTFELTAANTPDSCVKVCVLERRIWLVLLTVLTAN